MKWMYPIESEYIDNYINRLLNALNDHDEIVCEFNNVHFVINKGDSKEIIKQKYYSNYQNNCSECSRPLVNDEEYICLDCYANSIEEN